jgi:hypothetical protein
MYGWRNVFPGIFDAHLNVFMAADGVLYFTLTGVPEVGTWHDAGRWHITPDGQFCSRWRVWGGRREGCAAVYREGETFELYRKDRLDKGVYRREAANPGGY